MEPATEVIVHSAPTLLRVEVRGDRGELVALGDNLKRTGDSPMTRLRVHGNAVEREETWPTAQDAGLPVILPGGEVGILKSWWNADGQKEWRWTVEFYNHR